MARQLATDKASEVWMRHRSDGLILGADTLVVTDRGGLETALGKPVDEDDARRMLALLSGTTHTVYTGVALVYPDQSVQYGEWFADYKTITEVCDTQVQFRELTPAMIDAYIDTGEPFDKAGAYGIQGYAAAFVEAVYGDYFNVVGLPVQTVGRMLEKVGIEWWQGEQALR
jgi:septum formation protein